MHTKVKNRKQHAHMAIALCMQSILGIASCALWAEENSKAVKLAENKATDTFVFLEKDKITGEKEIKAKSSKNQLMWVINVDRYIEFEKITDKLLEPPEVTISDNSVFIRLSCTSQYFI